MNQFTTLTLAASIAASFFSVDSVAVAAERAAAPVQVVGEKVDSGLGDLPHYSQWADPSGKNPVQAKASASRGDKQAQRPSSVQVSQSK
jgi:hypothetical protein